MANFKSISELWGLSFVIPTYQRGYRWERQHVHALLRDLTEFLSSTQGQQNVFYCLQPIVVCKDSNNAYILADGQQRVTTLLLLTEYLRQDAPQNRKHELGQFNISFDTRRTQTQYLANHVYLNAQDASYRNNIDTFYLRRAYDVISEFFGQEEEDLPKEIRSLLKRQQSDPKPHVRVIWYELSAGTELDTFLNLNSHKIPLHSWEIIKGLILSTDIHASEAGKAEIRRIGAEWDQSAMCLADTHLTSMIGSKPNDMFGVVFDFVADSLKSANPELFKDIERHKGNRYTEDLFNYYIFSHYIFHNTNATRLHNIKTLWAQIQDVINLLSNWCNTHTDYHLIGLYSLIKNRTGVDLLKDVYGFRGNTKSDLRNKLKAQIGKAISVPVYDGYDPLNHPNLHYGGPLNTSMINILRAHNVYTVLQSSDNGEYVRFDLMRAQETKSLEHIHPQHLELSAKTTVANVRQWLDTRIHAGVDSIKPKVEELKRLLDNELDDSQPTLQMQQLISDIDTEIAQHAGMNSHLHHISNMALVDVNTNSALSNNLLAAKRNILLQRHAKGESYVPPATLRIFGKHYSAANPGNMNLWEAHNREDYLADLNKAYNYFVSNTVQP